MLERQRLRRVLRIGSTVVSELDLETVLQRVLEEARELTDARYAALGVLDADKHELERFLTAGAPPGMQEAIGDLPRGRGVLGTLTTDPRPLRLSDIGDHPESFGFPAGHVPMRSFLGVPVLIRGEAWGNLYLTDKQGAGGFDDDDEEAIVLLASWAAIAIDNARAHQREQARRLELEQAVQGLEATTAIAEALGGETDLDHILDLVVEHARDLVDARGLLILLRDGDELVIRSVAGVLPGAVAGTRLPIDGTLGGAVLRSGRAERSADVRGRLRFGLADQIEAHAAMLVPLVFHGRAVGVLEAFDHQDGTDFSDRDERLLRGFAASAATAVVTAQSAASQSLQRSLRASDRERLRWARELHDETLQQLAALKMLLAGARRRGDAERLGAAVDTAVIQVDETIGDLRRLISDLRPAALDDLGLRAALEGLADRFIQTSGLQTVLRLDLTETRPSAEVEDTAYRIVQEALTNVVKHAGATRVDIVVSQSAGCLSLSVSDDGAGFTTHHGSDGFGLIGMRERVELVRGSLTVEPSRRGGTMVCAELPWPVPPTAGRVGA
jgi:signal transduction histidine kinase